MGHVAVPEIAYNHLTLAVLEATAWQRTACEQMRRLDDHLDAMLCDPDYSGDAETRRMLMEAKQEWMRVWHEADAICDQAARKGASLATA